MSHYKPYPAYKDSGVEWIGEVPEGWKVLALKRMGTLKGGNGFPPSMQGREGNEFPFYKVGDLGKSIDGMSLGETRHSISKEDAANLGATIFKPGALAWAKIGAALSLNRRRVIRSACCLDNNMTGFTPDASVASTTYCFYLLSSIDFSLHAKPGAVPSFSEGDQGELMVTCPSLEEQCGIVNFLDRETARIDALIAKKTRFIELLKEKRQALITHAVTKGLDPNVKMKDSGVAWIGEVPEGWKVLALKRMGTLKGGNGFPPSMQGREGNEFPFYKVGDLGKSIDGMSLGETRHSISKEDAANLGATIFKPGALAWAKIGAALSLNRRRVIRSACCLDNNMTGFTPDASVASTTYCFYLLSSIDFSLHAKPGAVPSFSEGDQGELMVTCPSLEEQCGIVNFLDRETARIDALIAKTQHSIDLLKERRSAFITAAVTGQIDLREEA